MEKAEGRPVNPNNPSQRIRYKPVKCESGEQIRPVADSQPRANFVICEPNFAGAQIFLNEAIKFHNSGDVRSRDASLRLIVVALGLSDGLRTKLHTAHLGRL